MGNALSVDVDAVELDRLLARIGRELPRAGKDALFDTARDVATVARGNLPRRTGRLAGSVRVVPESDGAVLTVEAVYAAWIEYGGSRGRRFVPEGRYVGPAADGAADDAAALAARYLDRRV